MICIVMNGLKYGFCLLTAAVLLFACGEEKKEVSPEGIVLSDPTNIRTWQETDRICISWDRVAYADYYVVEGSADPNHLVAMGNVNSSYYQHEMHGVSSPLTMYFRIKAVKVLSDGSTAYSESRVVSYTYTPESSGGEGDGENYLPAPANVKAVKTGDMIVVTWDAVSGAERYEVYHAGSADGNYSSYGYWTDNRYVDEVVLVTDNYYKVKAQKGALTSDFSSYAYCNYATGGGDTSRPSTPTGLRAEQTGESIVVSWNAVPDVYYYRLWYSTPMGMEDFTNVYAPETSCVFDRNMKEGTYTFWIQSVTSDYEESAASGRIDCFYRSGNGGGGGVRPDKLDTPTNLQAVSGSYYVQISFDEVTLAYEYELYRSTSVSSGYEKIPASGGTTGGRYVLTDQNPLSGTTYYKVKAKALDYLDIADSDLSSYVKVVR